MSIRLQQTNHKHLMDVPGPLDKCAVRGCKERPVMQTYVTVANIHIRESSNRDHNGGAGRPCGLCDKHAKLNQ